MSSADYRSRTPNSSAKAATVVTAQQPTVSSPLQSATIQRALQDASALTPGDVQQLQSRIGNQAVIQLMARRTPPASSLSIGPEGGVADGDLQKSLQRSVSGGQDVPSQVQRKVGQATGTDFSSVRVHNDNNSHALNTHLQAKAFTHGNHIFLGKNQSPHDVQLMAHELTHTIQQGAVQQSNAQSVDRVQRTSDGVAPISGRVGTAPIQRQLDLDKENWDKAKQVKKNDTGEGVTHIYLLYDKKDKKDKPADPRFAVKLVKDGAEQAMASEMMAELKLPGAIRTKVIARNSKSGKKLEKTLKVNIAQEINGFVVMEYATNLSTFAGPRMGGMTDQEFHQLILSMQKADFFYDLGKIHAADMYMGNEDRLNVSRTTIKNVFVSKNTGQALPLDLGMLGIGKTNATTKVMSAGTGVDGFDAKYDPASVPGRELHDFVNLSIEGSMGKRQTNKAPRIHGGRGQGMMMPDLRDGLDEGKIDTVIDNFRQAVINELSFKEFSQKYGDSAEKLRIWQQEIDWNLARQRFKQGVHEAMYFYTSQDGRWQQNIQGIKGNFGLKDAPYMSEEVFGIKDRYAKLIRAGYSDVEAQQQVRDELEQGKELPIKWIEKDKKSPRGQNMLAKRRKKQFPKPGRETVTPRKALAPGNQSPWQGKITQWGAKQGSSSSESSSSEESFDLAGLDFQVSQEEFNSLLLNAELSDLEVAMLLSQIEDQGN